MQQFQPISGFICLFQSYVHLGKKITLALSLQCFSYIRSDTRSTTQ